MKVKKGNFAAFHDLLTYEWDIKGTESEVKKLVVHLEERVDVVINGNEVIGAPPINEVQTVDNNRRVKIGEFKAPQPSGACYRIVWIDAPGGFVEKNWTLRYQANPKLTLGTPQILGINPIDSNFAVIKGSFYYRYSPVTGLLHYVLPNQGGAKVLFDVW